MNGVQLCDYQTHHKNNNTDAHSENGMPYSSAGKALHLIHCPLVAAVPPSKANLENVGVSDFHNDNANKDDQYVAGKLPGTNITTAYNEIGDHDNKGPPPGSSVFEGHLGSGHNGVHDTHQDAQLYEDHKQDGENGAFDWKSQAQGPDGSTSSSNIEYGAASNMTNDVQASRNGTKDVFEQDSNNSGGTADFSKTDPNQGSSSLRLVGSQQGNHQKEEFHGNGVYDFHEQSSSTDDFGFKLDGEGAIDTAKQSLQDMSTVFSDNEEEEGKDNWFAGSQYQHPRRDLDDAIQSPGVGEIIMGLPSSAVQHETARNIDVKAALDASIFGKKPDFGTLIVVIMLGMVVGSGFSKFVKRRAARKAKKQAEEYIEMEKGERWAYVGTYAVPTSP